jgi:hypothetical protein
MIFVFLSPGAAGYADFDFKCAALSSSPSRQSLFVILPRPLGVEIFRRIARQFGGIKNRNVRTKLQCRSPPHFGYLSAQCFPGLYATWPNFNTGLVVRTSRQVVG